MSALSSSVELESMFGASPWAIQESRRASARRGVVLPCQAVRERDFSLIADRTIDISASGLLLPLRTHVLTGDSLIISFVIQGLWIDAEATVARVIHGRRPGDDGLAVGVVFDRLAASSRAALAAFLHGRKPPLPRRGPLARVRRGEELPKLADEGIMQTFAPLAYELGGVYADENDVVDDDAWDDVPAASTASAPGAGSAVDGFGILRAVLDAWQSLSVEAPNDAQ